MEHENPASFRSQAVEPEPAAPSCKSGELGPHTGAATAFDDWRLCDVTSDAVLVTNRAGGIVYGNERARQLFDYTSVPLIGVGLDRVIPGCELPHPRDLFVVAAAVRALGSQRRSGRRRDGSELAIEVRLTPLDWSGEPHTFVVVRASDTKGLGQTPLLTAAAAGQADPGAERVLAAVGRLAGGVAHDLNNALTAILSVTEARLAMLERREPLHTELEQIQRAAERAGTLTTQLLAFARKQMIRPRPIDVSVLVSQLEPELRQALPPRVKLVLSASDSLGSAELDPKQFQLMLQQLIVNACDAMPHGGDLTVETAGVTLPADCQTDPDAAPGDYVMLAITDTGVGMDARTRNQVFEPFFTTKATGHSGLGLAMVYGLVKQASGHVTVHSALGHGSCFKLYFPRLCAAPLPVVRSRPALPSRAREAETILLVDDDELVRGAALSVLRHAGYRVVEARGPRDALALFRLHEPTIDLVLTDLMMPEMNGRELIEVLLAERPDLGVLYMSGCTHDAIVRAGVLQAQLQFLQKPFSRASLTAKVRETLDRRTAK